MESPLWVAAVVYCDSALRRTWTAHKSLPGTLNEQESETFKLLCSTLGDWKFREMKQIT